MKGKLSALLDWWIMWSKHTTLQSYRSINTQTYVEASCFRCVSPLIHSDSFRSAEHTRGEFPNSLRWKYGSLHHPPPPPPPSLSCPLTANQSAAAGRQAVVLYLGHNSRMPTQLTEPQSGLWRRWHQTAHWVKHVDTLRGNREVLLRRVVKKKDVSGS